MKKKHNLLKFFSIVVITGVAILGGYLLGSHISAKYFTINKYDSISAEELWDDISKIDPATTSPLDLSAPLAFQVAEKVQINSANYEIIGVGTIETSAGVNQSSYTIDRRTGDDLYIAFATYSSIVKTSRQASYQIGGDVKMFEGTPQSKTLDGCSWSDKFTNYTWEGYKETFGKYANVNCCYIVSTKTILEATPIEKDGELFKSTIKLDPLLAGVNYAKQIGANMGADYNQVTINELTFTFWVDENFKFVKQEKFESYTVPYAGINLTLNSTIETNFNIQ